MQEASTFNIFYDGTSFQHLTTVLISVFTLCYGLGLLNVLFETLSFRRTRHRHKGDTIFIFVI